MKPTAHNLQEDKEPPLNPLGESNLPGEPEKLVKSADRVRDLGEVFTPTGTVQAMLDTLPGKMWRPHPSATFLEPACGDGNFLVAIFDRKAKRVADAWRRGTLPAGIDRKALYFHLLEALASIYGIDISKENVDGDPPAHPLGARERMIRRFQAWNKDVNGRRLSSNNRALKAAEWIVWRNIQVGDMLPFNSLGKPASPDVPLVQYEWDPPQRSLRIFTTTIADVLDRDTGSLFGPPPPQLVWEGLVDQIHQVKVPIPDKRIQTARNGKLRNHT